eukprot:5411297-Lingulodinium_polyedra.AAC.1
MPIHLRSRADVQARQAQQALHLRYHRSSASFKRKADELFIAARPKDTLSLSLAFFRQGRKGM